MLLTELEVGEVYHASDPNGFEFVFILQSHSVKHENTIFASALVTQTVSGENDYRCILTHKELQLILKKKEP